MKVEAERWGRWWGGRKKQLRATDLALYFPCNSFIFRSSSFQAAHAIIVFKGLSD